MYGSYTVVGQLKYLALLAGAIAVQVAPEQQAIKADILGIDGTVPVGVELSERAEAVLFGTAEQFRYAIDGPIAIGVANKERVVRRDPTGALAESVPIEVEERPGLGN